MKTKKKAERPWPAEIRLSKSKDIISIEFDSGEIFDLAAEFLRVESPSAEVQGHGGQHKIIVPGCRNIKITGLEPVGNYALRIKFDDGHDTGLYSWRGLYDLGREHETLWQTYLDALQAAGLSRDA